MSTACSRRMDDSLSGLTFAEYLGIQPRFTDNNRTGGSSFLMHAMHAPRWRSTPGCATWR